jgi:lipopolysaccharide export system permease protein
MKVHSIVNRYIFAETIPPFLVNLVLFTFIFLMAKILEITDLVVNHGVRVSSVLLLLIYSIPSFLVFVIPMSIMMGVLLAFLRLSSDNEIVALRACGFSLYRLLPPVLVFCLIGCLVTAFMCIHGARWGRLSFKSLLVRTATSNIDIGLKERTFNDSFNGVMLYVNEIDGRNKTLADIFVEDRQTAGMVNAVVAPEGKLLFDPKNASCHLTLFNGIINQVDQQNKTVHSINFDTYDFNLKLAEVLSARKYSRKSRKDMSLAELRQTLEKEDTSKRHYASILMEYHKKFSIPFACLVLGFMAVPLGIQANFRKRSFGMVLGLFFFLAYYILLTAGWVLGEGGFCSPVIAMWGPNLIIGAIGLYLLVTGASERSLLARLTSFVNTRRDIIRGQKGRS